jgi:hypothetical protein
MRQLHIEVRDKVRLSFLYQRLSARVSPAIVITPSPSKQKSTRACESQIQIGALYLNRAYSSYQVTERSIYLSNAVSVVQSMSLRDAKKVVPEAGFLQSVN